jgi:6-pyruvoyltetrahydropterin/6-carboxytetrahydropterin synthase
MRVTRRYRFSASHRLHTPMLSEDENRKLYGKCANPFGHGHDYVLDVTVEGAVDATGQVVERAALDEFVRERILRRVEYKNLNVDLTEFSTMVPTTENLARLVRDLLLDNWNLAPRLAHLRIWETDRNAFDLEVC